MPPLSDNMAGFGGCPSTRRNVGDQRASCARSVDEHKKTWTWFQGRKPNPALELTKAFF